MLGCPLVLPHSVSLSLPPPLLLPLPLRSALFLHLTAVLALCPIHHKQPFFAFFFCNSLSRCHPPFALQRRRRRHPPQHPPGPPHALTTHQAARSTTRSAAHVFYSISTTYLDHIMHHAAPLTHPFSLPPHIHICHRQWTPRCTASVERRASSTAARMRGGARARGRGGAAMPCTFPGLHIAYLNGARRRRRRVESRPHTWRARPAACASPTALSPAQPGPVC